MPPQQRPDHTPSSASSRTPPAPRRPRPHSPRGLTFAGAPRPPPPAAAAARPPAAARRAMVLLPSTAAPDGWELLRGAASEELAARRGVAPSAAAAGSGPVLVFAAAGDVDAVASVRVLTALLKADLTRYEVHPVSGYADLVAKFARLARGPTSVEPRAVLCINCGAPVDLERMLGLNAREDADQTDVRIFVLDCHRPYHLRNIKSKTVVLFDDTSDFNHQQLPLDVDWEDEWGNVSDEQSSSSSSDDDSESDYDSEDDVDLSGREDRDAEELDDEDADEQTDERAEEQADEHSSRQETDRSSPPDDPHGASLSSREPDSPQPRKRKRKFRPTDAEASESDGSSDREGSVPSSGEADGDGDYVKKGGTRRRPLKRAKTGRKKRHRRRRYGPDPEAEERERLKEYYAHASVGMSSAALSHSIASVLRRSNIDTLWMAIVGVTSQYVTSTVPIDMYNDAYGYFQTQIDVLMPKPEEDDGQTSRVQKVGYAAPCTGSEVQRIAPNVELRLDLLRHWSLHDSLLYSSYTATRLASWRQLGRRRLLELLATLGIPLKESREQWCYMKYKHKKALEDHLDKAIMRFDLGESFHYDSFVRSMPGHKGDVSAADYMHAVASLLEFDDQSQENKNGDPSTSMVDRFWRAYDALDCTRSSQIDTGLEMAVSVQKLTVDVAADVIERRKFVQSGPFCYTFLRDQQYKEYLSHPLLLRRLALFLTKTLLRQGAKDKPCVVLAADATRNVWIAVAATTPGQTNDFGHRFRKAADRNGSQVRYDGFDSSVCEIRDGQEIEFIRFLHDVMR